MTEFSNIFYQWVSSYYKNALIGKDGDFYTSVSASRFFGGSIANYILNKLEDNTFSLPINIIDLGGNSLTLLKDIYDFLIALGNDVAKYCNFILIESNAIANLNNYHIGNFSILNNLNSLEKLDKNTIFIANEFFDAFPCELFDNGKILFMNSSLDKFEFANANFNITKLAQEEGIKTGEIPYSYFNFINTLNNINPNNYKWLFLVFDYGDKIYTNYFNIRIFYKHKTLMLFDGKQILPNLNIYFKNSDITYNVPFSILDRAFNKIDSKSILFKRQDLAMIEDFNVLSLVENFYQYTKTNNNILYIREINKIKTLFSMWEKFKVSIYVNF